MCEYLNLMRNRFKSVGIWNENETTKNEIEIKRKLNERERVRFENFETMIREFIHIAHSLLDFQFPLKIHT